MNQKQGRKNVAVVTGSSVGIGRAIALSLAKAGSDVVIHAAKSRAQAEEVAEEVRVMGNSARRDHV